ncbi:unnamed protein product [Symbiodinium sp. CCMP2456]|nr:unnamed protein product [Symbiodinium sp. CCMP2456]
MLPLCYRRTFIDIEVEPMKLLRCNSVPAARRAGEDEDAQVSKDLASVYKRMEEWRSEICSATTSSDLPVSGSEIQNSEEATAEEEVADASGCGTSDETLVSPTQAEDHEVVIDEGVHQAANPGSYGHPEVCRKPCIFFQVGQCENGDSCGYCHLRHEKRPRLPDRRQRSVLRKLNKSELLQTFLPILWSEARRAGMVQEAEHVLEILEAALSTMGAPRAAKLVGDDAEYLKGLLLRMSFGSLMAMLLHNMQPGVFVDAARREMEEMRRSIQLNA